MLRTPRTAWCSAPSAAWSASSTPPEAVGLTHFVCVNGLGEVIMPCRCRQLLYEHGGKDLVLLDARGRADHGPGAPQAFGPEDLRHVTEASG